MRVIARSRIRGYADRHPDALAPLQRWLAVIAARHFETTDEVVRVFGTAKVINRERVRFAIGGGRHRLVAAFDFARSIVYIKFIGTHAEYDRIDAATIGSGRDP